MKYYELELNGRTIKFRLTSNDCIVIEKQTGKPITDYFSELSMTTVITLLRYMVRSSQPQFNEEDAGALYDELIDAGYTLESIITDVIMEALVVSGFMKKDDLAMTKKIAKEAKEEIKKTMKE